jgi:hypothetical protein
VDYHFRGEIKDIPLSADLERFIILQSPGLNGKAAVCHFLDHGTEGNNAPLPVIVVIGINYSQHSSTNCYLTADVPIWGVTGMRGGIDRVLSHFRTANPPIPSLPTEYHVVGTNIFPWITTTKWGDLNCHDEMILMQMHGYSNPVAICDDLIISLRPHLAAIIFHGDN